MRRSLKEITVLSPSPGIPFIDTHIIYIYPAIHNYHSLRYHIYHVAHVLSRSHTITTFSPIHILDIFSVHTLHGSSTYILDSYLWLFGLSVHRFPFYWIGIWDTCFASAYSYSACPSCILRHFFYLLPSYLIFHSPANLDFFFILLSLL